MLAQDGIAVTNGIQKIHLIHVPPSLATVFFPDFSHLGAAFESVRFYAVHYVSVNIITYPIPHFLRNLLCIFRQVCRSIQQSIRQRVVLVISLGFECFYVHAFQNVRHCLLVQLNGIGECFENAGAVIVGGKTDMIAAVVARNAQDS